MGAAVCTVLLFYHLVYQNYCVPVTRARVGSSRSWLWNAVKRQKIYELIEFPKYWQQSESVKHMGALLLLIDCSYSVTLTSPFSHTCSECLFKVRHFRKVELESQFH